MFGAVPPLASLEKLDLRYSRATDETIAGLIGYKSLNSLDLSGSENLTPSCLNSLAAIKSLRHLNLNNTPVLNNGVAKIAELKNLTSISISGCRISDEDLPFLAGLTNLRRLEMNGCQGITAKGLELLKHLRLEFLSLYYIKALDDQQVIALAQRSWPNCNILLPSATRYAPRKQMH